MTQIQDNPPTFFLRVLFLMPGPRRGKWLRVTAKIRYSHATDSFIQDSITAIIATMATTFYTICLRPKDIYVICSMTKIARNN